MASYNTPSARVNAYLATTDALTNEREQLSQDRYRSTQSLLAQSQQAQRAKEFDLEYQMKKRAEDVQIADRKRKMQSDALLAQAFKANLPADVLDKKLSSDEQLAEKMKAAGKKIMGINPEEGMRLFKEAASVLSNAKKSEIDMLQIMQTKESTKADLAASIVDQSTLDAALPQLANLGVKVTEDMMNWGPQSQEVFTNMAVQSPNRVKNAQLKLTEDRARMQAEDIQSKMQERADKTRIAERKQIALQNKVKLNKTTPMKKLDIKMDVDQFAARYEKFDDLDSEIQKAMVQDINSLAASFLKENPGKDAGVAKERAARELVSLIKDDGTYDRLSGAGGAPQEALSMLANNPSLAPKFKEKYGYLPEGY